MFAPLVEEARIDDADALVRDDVQPRLVAPHPAQAQRPYAPVKERRDIGADLQFEVFVPAVDRQVGDVVLDLLVEQNGRLDLARPAAGGADVLHLLDRHGTHALARDLHQTELRERKDRMLGLVGGHQLGHLVVERLPVDRLVQIDEVDDDDAAQIAQAPD